MPRRVKVPTRERGELILDLIDEADGVWEPEWEVLRETIYGSLFSVVAKDTLECALRGWTRPLVGELGIPPQGALRKIPLESRQCFKRGKCPMYLPQLCFPESKNMPWCFEPDGVASEVVRTQATRAIETWREGVYLVVVKGDNGSIFRRR